MGQAYLKDIPKETEEEEVEEEEAVEEMEEMEPYVMEVWFRLFFLINFQLE